MSYKYQNITKEHIFLSGEVAAELDKTDNLDVTKRKQCFVIYVFQPSK